jgi:hypothetical protein
MSESARGEMTVEENLDNGSVKENARNDCAKTEDLNCVNTRFLKDPLVHTRCPNERMLRWEETLP